MTTETKPRKLTVTDAIEEWERTTRAIEGLKIIQKEAAEVLIEHGKKTGKRSFKDRIAMVSTGGSLTLDQPAVRAYLGAKLADFQTRTKTGWTLKLLH